MRRAFRVCRVLVGVLWVGSVYVFLLAPIAVVVASSFDGRVQGYVDFPPHALSLRWYGRIPWRFFQAFGVSLRAASIATLISAPLGVLAALGIIRGFVPGRDLLRGFFRSPLQVPFVVMGVVFLQFYYFVYDLLGFNPAGTGYGYIVPYVCIGMAYTVGTVGAMLERSNIHLEEASEILGATGWETFWFVTFPLIKPGVFVGMMYTFIVAFGEVPIALFLSVPGFTTLPVEIFQTMLFNFDASILAISTLTVGFSVLLMIAVQKIVGVDIVLRGEG